MNAKKLIKSLKRRIEFHQNNQNDPHGIGTAVVAALSEVVEAIKESEREEAKENAPVH